MWNPFGKQEKQQDVTILTEDLKSEGGSLLIRSKGYMETRNSNEAWFLVHRWLIRMKSGKDVALISERNAIPIPLGLIFGVEKKEEIEKLTDLKPIGKEKYKETKNEMDKNASRNKWLMNAITIAALGMASFILIFAVIVLFQSGKIHIPGM